MRAADASERGRSSEGKCVRYCSRFAWISFFFLSSLIMGGWVGLGWGWGNKTLFYGM